MPAPKYRLIISILAIAGVGYALYAFQQTGINWLRRLHSLDVTYLALAFATLLLYVPGMALLWQRAVKSVDLEPITFSAASVHTGVSLLSKYIPGKIWGLAVKHQFVTTKEKTSTAATAVLSEQSAILISGAILAIPSAWLLEPWITGLLAKMRLGESETLVFVGLSLLTVALLLILVVSRKARRIFVAGLNPRLIALAFLPWLTSCLSFGLILASIDPSLSLGQLALSSATVPTAVITGMAMIFVPAGIGVRESVLVFLLAPLIGVETAVAGSILFRALAIVRDILAGVPCMLHFRKSTRPSQKRSDSGG